MRFIVKDEDVGAAAVYAVPCVISMFAVANCTLLFTERWTPAFIWGMVVGLLLALALLRYTAAAMLQTMPDMTPTTQERTDVGFLRALTFAIVLVSLLQSLLPDMLGRSLVALESVSALSSIACIYLAAKVMRNRNAKWAIALTCVCYYSGGAPGIALTRWAFPLARKSFPLWPLADRIAGWAGVVAEQFAGRPQLQQQFVAAQPPEPQLEPANVVPVRIRQRETIEVVRSSNGKP